MSIDQLSVTIRPARQSDAPAVADLAALDSAPVPHGCVLVAVVSDELVAAYGVESGERIGDPFRRTAELLELLAVRAARLSPAPAPSSFSGRVLRRAMPRPRAV